MNHPSRIPFFLRRPLTGLALASVALLCACGKEPAATPQAPRAALAPVVTTALVESVALSREVLLDADILSLASPTVAAEVSGKVLSVHARPGEQVRKGQLLAVLDSADLALSAGEAAAQAAQLEALLAEKRRTLARQEELAALEYIARATLDATRADVQATERQLEAYRLRARQSSNQLAKARIAAPFDATVAEVKTAPGAFARAGDALFTLWSPASSTLRLKVPQELAGRVQPGQAVTLAWQGEVLQTHISQVRTDIDPASRTFEAQAEVPPALRTVTGAALVARLVLEERASMVVPALAVQLDGPVSFVYRLVDGKAVRTEIRPGKHVEGKVQVLEGLSEGDVVIAQGAAFIRNGQPVRLQGEEGRP